MNSLVTCMGGEVDEKEESRELSRAAATVAPPGGNAAHNNLSVCAVDFKAIQGWPDNNSVAGFL